MYGFKAISYIWKGASNDYRHRVACLLLIVRSELSVILQNYLILGMGHIDDVAGDDMNIDNEGVGSVKISKIEMGSVKLDNEGVGSVNLGMFKGGSLIIKNDGVGSVKAKVDCQSVNATSEGVGGVNLSGVTRQYNKKKGGIGGISDGGLTVPFSSSLLPAMMEYTMCAPFSEEPT